MTKLVAEELEHFGLLKSDEWSSDHGHVSITRSAMAVFVGKLQKDPLRAIVEDFIPALEGQRRYFKRGYFCGEIYKVIGTGLAQREIYELIRAAASRSGRSANAERVRKQVSVSPLDAQRRAILEAVSGSFSPRLQGPARRCRRSGHGSRDPGHLGADEDFQRSVGSSREPS